MTMYQWLGAGILSIMGCLLMWAMVSAMGWRDAILGLIFACVVTALIVVGVLLITEVWP